MSKFLLNLLLQISKALVYSKNQIFIRKRIFLHFRPNRPSGQPAQPQPTCFPTGRFPLSPLGLSPSASPACHLGPADCTSVAPYPIAASHSRKRISRKPPSLHECVLPENLPPPLSPYQPARPQPAPGLGLPAGPSRLAHHPGPLAS
jgi:hypothetical protein